MRVFLFSFLFLLVSSPGWSQKRFALLIGNASYQSPDQLTNPLRDVDSVAQALTACHFQTTVYKDLKKNDFQKAVETFINVVGNNTNNAALIYYSGHGILLDGKTYLVPIGAPMDIAGADNAWIDEEWIFDQLSQLKNKYNMLLLDACRKPPLYTNKGRSPTSKAESISWTPRNAFVMYSASPGQEAKDGDGDNSDFARAVVQHIREKGSTIESVFREVKNDVSFRNHEQTPWATTTLGNIFTFTEDVDNAGSRGRRHDGVVKVMCTAPCKVFVNGDSVGILRDSISVLQWTINEQSNTIRAESLDYPGLEFSRNFYATPDDVLNNLLEMIPMADIVEQREVLPAMRSLQYDNWQLVAGGTFQMGLNNGNNDERPAHEVHIRSFYLKRLEVSQDEWKAIMGVNPSGSTICDKCPVENVSWEDAAKFVTRLRQLTGESFRLPTEAEWEFAAQGGVFSSGNDKFSGSSKLERVGWFYPNSGSSTHPSGTLAANPLGFFDMSGNVAEWCNDWYEGSYNTGQKDNPKGPGKGSEKVVRGGCFSDYDQYCRVFSREKHPPTYKNKTIGLRLAKDSD